MIKPNSVIIFHFHLFTPVAKIANSVFKSTNFLDSSSRRYMCSESFAGYFFPINTSLFLFANYSIVPYIVSHFLIAHLSECFCFPIVHSKLVNVGIFIQSFLIIIPNFLFNLSF